MKKLPPKTDKQTDRQTDRQTDGQADRQSKNTRRLQARKQADYKRLKKYCEGRKKQKESSRFSHPGFPVSVFPSRFSRPGFPVPVFREQILEDKFFISDFGRKKWKFPVSVSKTGTGKLRSLIHTNIKYFFNFQNSQDGSMLNFISFLLSRFLSVTLHCTINIHTKNPSTASANISNTLPWINLADLKR